MIPPILRSVLLLASLDCQFCIVRHVPGSSSIATAGSVRERRTLRSIITSVLVGRGLDTMQDASERLHLWLLLVWTETI